MNAPPSKFDILTIWTDFIRRLGDEDEAQPLFEEWYEGNEALDALEHILTLVANAREKGSSTLRVLDIESIIVNKVGAVADETKEIEQ